jgi:hypothetical protein
VRLLIPVGLVVLLLLGGTGLSGADHVSAGKSPPVLLTARKPGQIQHVVLIVLENEQLSEVWGHGPYERYLASTYGNATNYYAACHPSAGNYLAMIAAVTNQCGTDNWYNYTDKTLGDRLGSAGMSWANYAENLPASACPNPGGTSLSMFQVHHLPFLFFADVLRNQSFCRHHILPSSEFNRSVANGTMLNFSFYSPNMCDNGHNGCGSNTTSAQLTAQADAWLHGFLSPMLNHTGRYSSRAAKNSIAHTLFIVTWDEGSGSNAGYKVAGVKGQDNYLWCAANLAPGDAVCGGQVYTVFVSPYSMGRSYTGLDAPYGLTTTVEWLFHLPPLRNPGHFDNGTDFPAMTTMFSFRSNRL